MAQIPVLTLEQKIENGILDGLASVYGRIVHPKTYAHNKTFAAAYQAVDELYLIPVIDVRRVKHFALTWPLNFATLEQFKECNFSEERIQQIRDDIEKREQNRLYQIEYNRKKGETEQALSVFESQFYPMTLLDDDELPEPRQTQCANDVRLFSVATHLPPLHLDLLLMQNYFETCVCEVLCQFDCTLSCASRVYYDFHFERTSNNDICKVYIFLSIVQ